MKWMFKAALLVIFFSLVSFYFAVRPHKIVSSITPKNLGMNYEDISFVTADGLTLKGWFIPAKIPTQKVIILLHGYPADKGDILPPLSFLHDQYNLLLFDFRYFGQSEGLYTTVGRNETLDVLAAIQYLKSRHLTNIGVWGFSMGAAAGIMSAAQSSDIKMLVADSSYARLSWMVQDHYRIPLLKNLLADLARAWGKTFLQIDIAEVNPADIVGQLKIPVLLLHSQDDNVIPYRHGELMKQNTAGKPNIQFITNHGLLHGQFAKEYQKIILDFFHAL